MGVDGWPDVFRGRDAVAAGLVTPGLLRGPAFERMLPGVYGAATGTPPDLARRSLAAYRWAGAGAVLCGWSAAELLGRSSAPLGAPAEVVVSGGVRSRPEVRVRRDRLHPGEITDLDGVRITSRLRTAFDLARWLPLTEGVVAVDALARGEFNPDLLLNFAARYQGLRGVRNVVDVLCHTDARSGSPQETRLRLLLFRAGLPRPAVQHPVVDDRRMRVHWLDLAYPDHRLGVEYDGRDHLDPAQVLEDIERHTRLAAAGWRVLRYTSAQMRREPDRIVAEVAAALGIDRATLRPC